MKTEQQKYNEQMHNRLYSTIMPWDDTLRMWHEKYAMESLKTACVQEIQGITQETYDELYETLETGLRMKTVQLLIYNIVRRNPTEMKMDPREYRQMIRINHHVAQRWGALYLPIKEAIDLRFKLQSPTINPFNPNMNGRS